MWMLTLQYRGAAARRCINEFETAGGEGQSYFAWKVSDPKQFVNALTSYILMDEFVCSIIKKGEGLEIAVVLNDIRGKQVLDDAFGTAMLNLVNHYLEKYARVHSADKIGLVDEIIVINFKNLMDESDVDALQKCAQKEESRIVKYGVQTSEGAANGKNRADFFAEMAVVAADDSVSEEEWQVKESVQIQTAAVREVPDDYSSSKESTPQRRENRLPSQVLPKGSLDGEKKNLQTFFHFIGPSISEMLSKGEFEEACSILRSRLDSPRLIDLMQLYVALVCSSQFAEAGRVLDEIKNGIVSLGYAAKDVLQAAGLFAQSDQVESLEKQVQAFLLFSIGARLLENGRANDSAAKDMNRCINGMSTVAGNLQQPHRSKIVAEVILPNMLATTNALQCLEDEDGNDVALQTARSYSLINYVAKNNTEWTVCTQIIGKGVTVLEGAFGENARKHKAYYHCLENDGFALRAQHKIPEAKRCFENAIKNVKFAKINEGEKTKLAKKWQDVIDKLYE